MKKFRTPKKTFGELDAGTVAQLVSASSDLALVLDKKGVIRDIAIENEDLAGYGCQDWIGSAWIDTVTIESRPKVEAMLAAAQTDGASNWRQVNHKHVGGHDPDLPIRYMALRLPENDRVLAMGQDLRPLSVLQQRLVAAQAQMETAYSGFRLAETRYQALFQLSSEAVLIVNQTDLKVTDANPAASALLDTDASQLVGRDFNDLIAKDSILPLQKLISDLHTSPRAGDTKIRFSRSQKNFSLTASLFRNGTASHYIMRFKEVTPDAVIAIRDPIRDAMTSVIARMPDAFVVLDQEHQIVAANGAFLDLAQLAELGQVRGRKIDRWVGRVEVDIDILMANLREHGALRRFPTVIRGEFGGREDVEISAVAVMERDPPYFGLSIRRPQPRAIGLPSPQANGMRSFEQLKALVGQVPLRDLVRETTDIIEQMCIEAALELTGDNRASAAEMLGLSRQSLYVKLRRHGLGDLDDHESTLPPRSVLD